MLFLLVMLFCSVVTRQLEVESQVESSHYHFNSTTIGLDKGGGHFEVIGGQIMRIFSSLSDFNKTWWMATTFGPNRSEVVLRSVEVKFA